MSQARDYAAETRDNPERRYAYDFDAVLRRYLLRAFTPFIVPGRALELGCYEGDFTALLASRFPDLTAVDVVPAAIEANRRRVGSGVHFVEGLIETVELPEAGFTSIFLTHVLEHLDDPAGVLRRVKGWLAPGGRVFVACPNAHAASRQLAVKMGLISHAAAVTPGEAAHGHRRTYSLDTLERDVRGGGLAVLYRGGVFFKPLANFQFDRLLPTDVISPGYLDACYELGMVYPDLCASVYVVGTRPAESD